MCDRQASTKESEFLKPREMLAIKFGGLFGSIIYCKIVYLNSVNLETPIISFWLKKGNDPFPNAQVLYYCSIPIM